MTFYQKIRSRLFIVLGASSTLTRVAPADPVFVFWTDTRKGSQSKICRHSSNLLPLSLTALAAMLFSLAFPGGGYPELAFVAMIPFCFALHRMNRKTAFFIGLLFGFLIWLFSTCWLPGALMDKLHTKPVFFMSIYLGFCLLSGLPYALFAYLYRRFHWWSITGSIKAALTLSILLSFDFYPLPGSLAHALYDRPEYLQAAEIGGVSLVLFLVLLVNNFGASALVAVTADKTRAFMALLLAILLLSSLYIFGSLRMASIEKTVTAQGNTVRIAGIQPNVPVDWREMPKSEVAFFKEVIELTAAQVKPEATPDLFIWPEIPIPFSYTERVEHKRMVDQLVARTKTPLWMNSGYVFEPYVAGQTQEYYNAMEFIGESGRQGRYFKRKLSPFGEYLPYEEKFPLIRRLIPGAHHYRPGTDSVLVPITDSVKGIPMICYDILFPELIRDTGEAEGGQVIINQVNDGWFDRTKASEIHLALARFRSIEFRMPMIRVANTLMYDDPSIHLLLDCCLRWRNYDRLSRATEDGVALSLTKKRCWLTREKCTLN